MSKGMRFIIVLLCIGLGVYFLLPTVQWYFNTPEDTKTIVNGTRERIRTEAVQMAAEDFTKIYEMGKEDNSQVLPEEYSYLIKEAKAIYKTQKWDRPSEWTIGDIQKALSMNEVKKTIEKRYRDEIFDLKDMKSRTLNLGLDLYGGVSVSIQTDTKILEEQLGHEPSQAEFDTALNETMDILNNRIDQFGVTEPVIRKQANNQILIEVPGADDPEEINRVLQGKGTLNLHLVNDEANDLLPAYISEHPDDIFENGVPAYENTFGEGTLIVGFYTKDSFGIDVFQRYVAINEEPGLEGEYITEAEVSNDPVTGQPLVIFRLSPEGSAKFFELTNNNTGKSLAVVMDRKIKGAVATILEPISGGAVSVRGFNTEECQNLKTVLSTGALPLSVRVENYQSVGSSLGEDAINSGVYAILIGFAAVFVFMLIYYKGAGFVASIALFLNLFFVVAILSSFNMTLSLTSIAGIILNVGMAVDANVIIFERIKEELRKGKNRATAVANGFKKAFWTVMDANITTFIAALFLSQLAKGPIQGFAVTLAVGIVCSLFTAIFVSRLFFDFGTEVLKKEKTSISWGKLN